MKSIIDGNKFVITSVVFVVATFIDMLLCLPQGIMEIDYFHLINRFAWCAIPIFTLFIFKHFENRPLFFVALIHYGITCGLVILWIWISGYFRILHPNAYVDGFRSYTMIYAIVFAYMVIYDAVRTRRANKELRELN